MILEQNPVESCAQCGAPLHASAGVPGCLNCLINAGLDETGARRFQHYEVELCDDKSTLRELGRGAMGVTYCARDLNLDSFVALKVIAEKFSSSAEVRARFRREARAAAKLRHPNVASVFHFGETENGRCFYVMELVEGETLEAKVWRDGPLPVALALEVATQIARALVAAEAQGLVHRDLKPSNVMIARRDDAQTLQVKVIDFGLAKVVSEVEPSARQSFSGTPGFASPEQMHGREKQPDARSDIYSLGAILFYALSGVAPEKEAAKTLKAPARVLELLRAMLAPEAAARPQTARELLVRLQSCQRKTASAKSKRYLGATAIGLVLVALVFAGLTSRHRPPPVKSIAVLPFANLSDDKENAFFAGGIQDQLLSDLARIADLKVTSRTSVAQYGSDSQRNVREIGRSLGVAHLVEGSVQRVGRQVRVVAQLIDARSDTHLWGQTYDRDLADTFALEDEIAEQIAQQLQAKISPAERSRIAEKPTSDLTAYGFYTRALSLDITSEHIDEKIALLQQAIARDPDFIVAQCFLARLYDTKYADANFVSLPDRQKYSDLARRTIDQALHLRPDRGEPHLALANHDFIVTTRYAEARAELNIALPLLPNNAAAIFLEARLDRHENRWGDALLKARSAFERDPHHEYYIAWTSDCYLDLRRYEEGEDFLREAQARNPAPADALNGILGSLALGKGDLAAASALTSKEATSAAFHTHFDAAYFARDYARALKIVAAAKPEFVESEMALRSPQSDGEGRVFLHQGLTAKAMAIFRAQRQIDQGIVPALRNEWYYSDSALEDARLGQKEQAIAEARKALDLHPLALDPVNGAEMIKQLALVYAALGEVDPAIEQLQILVKIPSDLSYGELRYSPDWDTLRGDPRFDKLIAAARQPVAGL